MERQCLICGEWFFQTTMAEWCSKCDPIMEGYATEQDYIDLEERKKKDHPWGGKV